MASFAPLLTQITSLEHQVWEALVKGDKTADAQLLSDDFLGVYSDGFAIKSDHVGQLTAGPTVHTYALTDLHIRQLGTDHTVLSYEAKFLRVGQTEAERMFISSIWQRQGASWVNIFSQDTPAHTEN